MQCSAIAVGSFLLEGETFLSNYSTGMPGSSPIRRKNLGPHETDSVALFQVILIVKVTLGGTDPFGGVL